MLAALVVCGNTFFLSLQVKLAQRQSHATESVGSVETPHVCSHGLCGYRDHSSPITSELKPF